MKRIWLSFWFLLLWGPGIFAQKDTLVVGVYESPPFVVYNEDGTLGGISVWLWEQIEKDLEQPYRVERYPEAHSLEMLIDDVQTGVIDMSINPLTITSNRDDRVDFTHPFFIGNLTVAKIASSRIRSFLVFLRDFFTPRVLLLILVLVGMVVFFGGLIWLIERKNRHFERNLEGLLSSFWWSAVTMTTVGYGDKVPVSNLGRIIAFLWMLCSVIIISIFTASVTSSLTVRQMAETDLSVETFSRARVGTVESSASEDFLQRNFYRKLTSYPDLREGLKGLSEGEVDFFIYDEPWLMYQLNNNPAFAEMELLPVRFQLELYAMPMNREMDPGLKREITSLLIQIQESGDWEKVLREYQLRPF